MHKPRLLVATAATVFLAITATQGAGPVLPAVSSPVPTPRVHQPAPQGVLTLIDYFEGGRRAVDTYVSQVPGDADLEAIIRKAKEASVRVEIRTLQSDSSYQSVMGSGVLVNEGRHLLTSGHALDGQADYEIIVTLTSGETRTARLDRQAYELFAGPSRDWAVLEMLGEPVDVPRVEIAEAEQDSLAIILGYPDHIGINERGDVVYGSAFAGRYLEPLVTLGIVEDPDRVGISPCAGSVPTGGMSGGPVFDGNGRLIGIFVSISRMEGSRTSRYAYNASRVLPLLEKSSND